MVKNHKEGLAYAVLLLERQLESYQKLHAEEMEALWKTLAELKKRILGLEASGPDSEQPPAGTANAPDYPDPSPGVDKAND